MEYGLLTSQPTEEIEETMETGIGPLVDHGTYSNRKTPKDLTTYEHFHINTSLADALTLNKRRVIKQTVQ